MEKVVVTIKGAHYDIDALPEGLKAKYSKEVEKAIQKAQRRDAQKESKSVKKTDK